MNRYTLHGATLTSDRWHPLFRLLAAADAGGAVPVTLRTGAIALPERDPVWQSPFASAGRDGNVRLRIPGTADLCIDGDAAITLDPTADADDAMIDMLLAGPASAVLAMRRGHLPLRGACVAIAGRAVMIAGPPARGASSLAAALIARGARLVSDATCVVSHDPKRDPMALPGAPWIALRRDAQPILPDADWQALGHGSGRSIAQVKAAAAPLPLAAIVRPGSGRGEAPSLARIGGAAALAPIADLVPLYALAQGTGRGAALFALAMRVAGDVPVFALERPDLARLDRAAAAIEAMAATA